MFRRTLLMLLSLALVLVVGACGGGDDDSADAAPDEAAGADGSDGAAEGEGEDDSGSTAEELGVDRTFTGEGSEPFCTEVKALQASLEAAAPDVVDDATFAEQMAALTPPAEIAAEWTNLYTVQRAMATDPSGEELAQASEEEVAAWGESSAVVAAYLGDVCGMG